MRYSFALVLMFAACNGSSGDPSSDKPAFTITSAPITVAPGEEFTKCFYFTTQNLDSIAVTRWVSEMSPGSHHMIMFSTLTGTQPPDGTIDEQCGGGGALQVPVFATQVPHDEIAFPTDDGEGKPLAQLVESQSKGFFQMHYFNSTDQPITASITLSAYGALADEAPDYTRTDIFATYNNDIRIAPGETNKVVSATCDVVDGKFFSLSTHAHKQAIATRIAEGGDTVFTSNDWEHPGNKVFAAPTFYQFSSGKLTWECTYNNTGDNAARTIRAGQSAKTDEMCMATGYYFPAIGARGCFMDSGECTCFL
jgi:hypothetical protein